jgi:hypothetical protein
VRLVSPRESRIASQQVTVQTNVVALASCNRSVALIVQSADSSDSGIPITDTLLTDAALVFVDLRVIDADGIPIRESVPDVVVLWGPTHQIVPTKPKPAEGGSHSNRFTASIDASLRSAPGSYRLQVVLRDGWNEALGAGGDCILLERIVRVEKPGSHNVVWISVGSLVACTILVGAIVFWARRTSAELQNVLLMVVTEACTTVISMSFKLGNLAAELFATYRVVFEGIVKSPHYRVPYAVFGCLSIVVGLVLIVHLVRRASELCYQVQNHAEIQPEPSALSPRRTPPGKPVEPAEVNRATVHKLEWELKKVSRDRMGLAVGVLGLLLQDLPMVRAHANGPSHRHAESESEENLAAFGVFGLAGDDVGAPCPERGRDEQDCTAADYSTIAWQCMRCGGCSLSCRVGWPRIGSRPTGGLSRPCKRCGDRIGRSEQACAGDRVAADFSRHAWQERHFAARHHPVDPPQARAETAHRGAHASQERHPSGAHGARATRIRREASANGVGIRPSTGRGASGVDCTRAAPLPLDVAARTSSLASASERDYCAGSRFAKDELDVGSSAEADVARPPKQLVRFGVPQRARAPSGRELWHWAGTAAGAC